MQLRAVEERPRFSLSTLENIEGCMQEFYSSLTRAYVFEQPVKNSKKTAFLLRSLPHRTSASERPSDGSFVSFVTYPIFNFQSNLGPNSTPDFNVDTLVEPRLQLYNRVNQPSTLNVSIPIDNSARARVKWPSDSEFNFDLQLLAQ